MQGLGKLATCDVQHSSPMVVVDGFYPQYSWNPGCRTGTPDIGTDADLQTKIANMSSQEGRVFQCFPKRLEFPSFTSQMM